MSSVPCVSCPPCRDPPSGVSNETNLHLYMHMATTYRSILQIPQPDISSAREPKLVWPDKAIDILLQDRTQADPVCFKTIAKTLNRTFPDNLRPFTRKDCSNKWQRMFPSNQDALAANRYLNKLSHDWPGLKFKVVPVVAGPERDVYISEIHIVWPWAKAYMEALHHSVFCDATFNVTCFRYKVVMITTLDGNKQHRPLMCSFIIKQDANQWERIFNFFAEYVLRMLC